MSKPTDRRTLGFTFGMVGFVFVLTTGFVLGFALLVIGAVFYLQDADSEDGSSEGP